MTTRAALNGIHHVTAVTADAAGNHDFYTRVLGMRLVKKTVNQDDTTAYHLFYADAVGTPGSDLTFFDWPAPPEQRGSNAITRVALRVTSGLAYWTDRLEQHGVDHGAIREVDGWATVDFEDPEGQRLRLVEDASGDSHPHTASPVPIANQIRGLAQAELSVTHPDRTARFLTDILGMTERRSFTDAGRTVQVFAIGTGSGSAGELHLREDATGHARQGAGGVHHVAFRIDDDAYDAWVAHYAAHAVRSSGPVDRFYFRSLYAREPNGILIELATDGPGFHADEPIERLGERLSLPPFLEAQRQQIERRLKPIGAPFQTPPKAAPPDTAT